jgi:hypothetical protein
MAGGKWVPHSPRRIGRTAVTPESFQKPEPLDPDVHPGEHADRRAEHPAGEQGPPCRAVNLNHQPASASGGDGDGDRGHAGSGGNGSSGTANAERYLRSLRGCLRTFQQMRNRLGPVFMTGGQLNVGEKHIVMPPANAAD